MSMNAMHTSPDPLMHILLVAYTNYGTLRLINNLC